MDTSDTWAVNDAGDVLSNAVVVVSDAVDVSNDVVVGSNAGDVGDVVSNAVVVVIMLWM